MAASSSTFPASTFGSSRPPQRERLGRGFAFALAAHALLVLALSAGLAWRTQDPPAFEAELWASVPVAAAPREQEPPPPPPEESKPEPAKPTPPPPEAQAEQQREAEIALAKERERKLKKQREEEELERKRLAEQEAKRRAELKKKEEALKQAKLKEEQAKKDKADKEKAEKAKADAAAKKAEAQAEAKREALRQENLKRIQGMAGASGGPQATGTALQSAGPSSSYAGRIKARVRPNIIYTDAGAANPLAEVEVRVAPDGTILSRRLVKPSGNAEWDAAVLRAIDKTETLPRDVDGRVPPLMVLAFQPRE